MLMVKDYSMCTNSAAGTILNRAKRRGAVNTPTLLTVRPDINWRRLLQMIVAYPYSRQPQLRQMVQATRIRAVVFAYPKSEGIPRVC